MFHISCDQELTEFDQTNCAS